MFLQIDRSYLEMNFMKQIIVIFFVISSLGCSKTSNISSEFQGTYKGTFKRNTSSIISNVTLNFSNTNFSGTSDVSRYPAISMGNYQVMNDSMRFSDASIWTADFDWTFILDGKYKMILKNDSLFMTRRYNGIVFTEDVYKLKKQ